MTLARIEITFGGDEKSISIDSDGDFTFGKDEFFSPEQLHFALELSQKLRENNEQD